MRLAVLALTLAPALVLGLVSCGSSPTVETAGASPAATASGPATTSSTLDAASATNPLAVATAFVQDVVIGADADGLVTGEDVVVALRDLLPFESEPTASVEPDAERNEVESGAPDECAISDVTAICYVIVDDVAGADPLHLQVFVAPDYPAGTTVMDGVVVGADGATLAGGDFPLLVDHVELVAS